jgi:adenylate kinase family enzyme
MEKVLILGCCGAGKSTFAKQLQTKTGLPLVHLDQVWWLPNWVEIDRNVFRQKIETLAAEPRWIIDGNYDKTLEIRLAKADTVIYIDFSTWKCLWRVIGRVWKYYGQQRPDMPEGCKERWDWAFMHYVATFNSIKRPSILRKIEAVAAVKTVQILRTDGEVAEFLQNFEMK